MKSYDAGPTDTAILDETIGENFERMAAADPGAEALVDVAGGRRWTYGELNAEVDLIARGLVSRGIEQGERIGIWAPNCPEWTIVQYATAKIGAILVTSNTTLLNNLVACDKQFGLETMCVGGGQGMAMVVERLSRKESQQMTAVERPHPQLSTER